MRERSALTVIAGRGKESVEVSRPSDISLATDMSLMRSAPRSTRAGYQPRQARPYDDSSVLRAFTSPER
jgi:hypothetical protein